MDSNRIIAEYDGYKVKLESNTSTWYNGKPSWPLYTKDGKTTDTVLYDTSMDWLYPVYIKLRKELNGIYSNANYNTKEEHFRWVESMAVRERIEAPLVFGQIEALHSEIVKGIEFINENKKQ